MDYKMHDIDKINFHSFQLKTRHIFDVRKELVDLNC